MSAQLDLVGVPEIAERLGVSRRTVITWNYRRRLPLRPPWQPFPEPLKTISGRPAWDWADVETWARLTGRLR